MSGYRIPWRKIENQSDLPALYSWVITSDDEGCVHADHRDREGYWVYSFGKVIAYAPLPAPYDPDAPEPVDMRAAILALAAELDKQAIVGMGVKDIAKRLRGIAG